MKKLLLLCFTLLSVHVLAAEPYPECSANCVKTRLIGEKLVVEQLDHYGKAVKIETIVLGQGVKLISANKVSSENSFSVEGKTVTDNPPAADVRTTEYRYETATEIIIVFHILHYDGEGNLINVSITQVRFPKPVATPPPGT